MKRVFNVMPIVAMVLMMSVLCSCGNSSSSQAEEVGMLTAYYATEDFKTENGPEYKKGQLICDSNDPINRIVEQDGNNYRYEGDETGAEYSWLLPKSKVEKKTYKMNQLPVNSIGDKAYFVSESGCVARIFWSNSNGHHFFNWNGKEEQYREEIRYKECYVLSVELINFFNNKKYIFEEQLEEKRGSLRFYVDYGGEDPNNCRYRECPIGLIEEEWCNKEGWDANKSAYDADGKLLVDQWESSDIPDEISIAYIADLDALYINGILYYRTNDMSKIASNQTKTSERKDDQSDIDALTPISIEEAYKLVDEMIVENNELKGFRSNDNVNRIMEKHGYKKVERYFIYKSWHFSPLYYKNCSLSISEGSDEADDMPTPSGEGVANFVGFDGQCLCLSPFTKSALDDYINQIEKSGAKKIEETDSAIEYKYKNINISAYKTGYMFILISKE